ncbi:uncharacterized protein LOC122576100 [Bombus pyrosoma]|uniref:uncharacterized protein LOC122576100 n=1 Tax=Bombus pyrosoma TaxID=396416 RepID=UPI001CB99F9C|nr:uncharacterized protein LOC122576100 [Bombus pyrosoma]XP_043601910.1 uncharacterized protein LOC122576100 [Bombus pyrosoma]XP_043601912.1 uncharacterized protein LOC122576100 [Bombus pyrosoma]
MELSDQQVDDSSLSLDTNYLQISCNWKISNNKQLRDAFTLEASSLEFTKTNFEDIVSLSTCISLQPIESNNEPCMLDVRLTNGQRISQIAVVSEAYVLEFFKQFGEYETTKFAEFVDEFEDNSVYFTETAIFPHATEASIKFTKTKSKNSVMWIYGIKLYVTESINEPKSFSTEIFNPEIIRNFLTKLNFNNEGNNITDDVQSCYMNILNLSKNKGVQKNNEEEVAQSAINSTVSNNIDIVTYIDKKFEDMEGRLMKKIDEMEQKTNEKLDTILRQLETRCSVK